ncbi:MAG: adenylate cyclase [Spirochaetes bacterium GWD1_61_31]|nr:MAG: adenylate cyclase [Spirochaetes bacterium GWB1_60_80]OHD34033.1 MAG: adenylate cyclase [Spirochaetes bacterium GWC1_61_12]OHD41413.1 MAG: adenylate cyclase [Spirochaetes bacterium GWE1_60_18]OHD43868.1 MAG: adenylate cyclase [Spirochaetes bacterium GWD1_61_31]OHD59210.1 MAG: adenylate cyclase [Spirochaetes bacterium GWF1_60_12]HAP43089.1 adenylate cyclase [Spirochaetaceae bacterium]
MSYIIQVGTSASQDRLDRLIEERLQPGSDKTLLDQRIWDLFGEDWAVMFTDLSGFSRHVAEFGIIHFLQVIHESQRLLVPVIYDHDGILLKMEGDSMMVIFRTAPRALECAIAMQRVLASYNVDKAAEDRVLLCVGLGFGRMLRIGDVDVFGTEVNAASKLGEDTAAAGQILVTGAVREAAGALAGLGFSLLADSPPGAITAFRLEFQL